MFLVDVEEAAYARDQLLMVRSSERETGLMMQKRRRVGAVGEELKEDDVRLALSGRVWR